MPATSLKLNENIENVPYERKVYGVQTVSRTANLENMFGSHQNNLVNSIELYNTMK